MTFSMIRPLAKGLEDVKIRTIYLGLFLNN
jgi:hypothetical protein